MLGKKTSRQRASCERGACRVIAQGVSCARCCLGICTQTHRSAGRQPVAYGRFDRIYLRFRQARLCFAPSVYRNYRL